jgi:hypothetical protein
MPGYVPEHDDGGPGKPLADEPGRECEVVVLHQDDRVLGIYLLAHRIHEPPVDRLVVLPVLAAEDRTGMRNVAKGPEALVGKPVVVALLLFG